jgi:competence ComEA-like helix-hairpin-helix protein
LLVLLGTVLVLLGFEQGLLGQAERTAPTGDWIRLTDPVFGSSFHSFRQDQSLGSLVAEALPRLSGYLDEGCSRISLKAATEIRFFRDPGTDERRCVVSPLPERCRYLLGMPLNVNRAEAQELELLPGIGPRLAQRILEVRASIGPFSSAEEFLRVPGIGHKLLEKVQGRVCF